MLAPSRLAALALLLAVACGASRSLAWEIHFGPGVDSSRAVYVEGRILSGGCGGAEIFASRASRAGTPSMPPELAAGTYGFAASAIDEMCNVYAEGCTEITLPVSSSSVVVELLVLSPRAECGADECSMGACGGVRRDAGALDAGALDAAAADGGPDAGCRVDADCGECGTCVAGGCAPADDGSTCTAGTCFAGACCGGCIIAGACVVGDTAVACGTGGGACARCECPVDSCEAGACTGGHPVTAITATSDHACVISSGALFCFGDNSFGQLGTGASGMGTEVARPTEVMTPATFTALAGGDEHVLALAGTDLYAWGANSDGQLGLGDTRDRATPARVTGAFLAIEGARVGDHSCAIRMDRSAACTGQGLEGQLGLGDLLNRSTFGTVGPGAVSLSAGHHHTCGIDTTGALLCWGENVFGELGLGTSGAATNTMTPTRVGTESDWTSIAAGDGFTCGVRAGELYCWGNNSQGQAAQSSTAVTTSPTRIGTASDWASVSLGGYHGCGLRTTGALYCWGRNTEGQLGRGSTGGSVRSPGRVGTAAGWSRVGLGARHTCAADADDALHCWGANDLGQLGLDDRVLRAAPAPVCW